VHAHNFNDLTDRRFGRLTVLCWAPRAGKSRWACRCACGIRVNVVAYNLVHGLARSCGCLRNELSSRRNRTHGMTRTPTYRSWLAMIARCYNERHKHYSNYGGRGVRVTTAWRRSFEIFLHDMGQRPSSEHTLDRFPAKNGNYTKHNCRWATRRQQMRNKRTNRLIAFRGQRLCLAAWAQRLGVRGSCIDYRLAHGWSVRDAFTTPSRRPAC
jgi:hypothetical protein